MKHGLCLAKLLVKVNRLSYLNVRSSSERIQTYLAYAFLLIWILLLQRIYFSILSVYNLNSTFSLRKWLLMHFTMSFYSESIEIVFLESIFSSISCILSFTFPATAIKNTSENWKVPPLHIICIIWREVTSWKGTT